MFVRSPSFTEPQLREAVAASHSFSDALRRIGLRPAGGNHATLKKYVLRWGIPTDHFSTPADRVPVRTPVPLEQVLVAESTYPRASLKRRLLETGLKAVRCELCGQDADWKGRRMALVLDHVNGVATDNRLENLRIVCPNCNATLDTHCGRNKPRGRPARACEHCGGSFRPIHAEQRFCSTHCASQTNAPPRRVVERPSTEAILAGVAQLGYEAYGREHGVSGNAVRKWLRSKGVDPPPGPGRAFNPPPRPPPALTDAQAAEALGLLEEGIAYAEIAASFGVSRWCIQDLRAGRTYRHVPRPGP